MGILRDAIEHVFPALSLSAGAAPMASKEMKRVLEQFREDRANHIANLADRAGRSGERLAITQRQCEAWRDYAKALERLCLAAGLEMPPAPDE